jgi:hypothetical protein
MFKVFSNSLQTFIDTLNCILEDRIKYINYYIQYIIIKVFLRVFVL